MTAEIRPATADDWAGIVELNNAEVPKVGPLTVDDGTWFLDGSDVLVVDDGDGGLAALLVLMAEGSDYPSPNYAWFAGRHDRFAYVDRITVRADQAGQGLGRALYDLAVERARAAGRPVLTAEVNVDPPNERSLSFHRRYGFAEVGQHVDHRNGHVVAMFALLIDADRADRADAPG